MKKLLPKIILLMLISGVVLFCTSCAGNSYDGAAQAYFNAFTKFDYKKMYDLLTPGSQGVVSYDEFKEYHKKVYDSLKIQSVKVEKGESVLNAISKTYDYTVTYTSSEYGTFTYDMQIEVYKKAGYYLVAWTPANIVPQMNWHDRIYSVEKLGKRGEIFDRDGRVIVQNDYAVTVYAQKDKLANVASAASSIAAITGKDASELSARFEKTNGNTGIFLTYFKGDLSSEQEEKLVEIENIKIDKSSITPIRYYPYGDALAQTLGYSTPITDEDRDSERYRYLPEGTRIGRSGIELVYNDYLLPKVGKQIYLLSDDSKTKTVLYEDSDLDGYDLKLTCDIVIQKNITDYMNENFKTDATGTANVIDPDTGKVVALVSYPSYNANVYAYDKATDYGDLFENKHKPLLNRNIQGTYPPGSIFKSIMALIGLETKSVTTETVFPYENEIEYYTPQKERWRPKGSNWSNYIIRQSFPNAGNKGRLDMHRGLTWSDNIYFGWLAMKVGKEKVIEFAEKLGIGESIPFDLPTRKTQLANSYDTLNRQKLLADTGFGQAEVLFTPLQLCATFSLFGNNGTIMQPYIVDEICTTNEMGYLVAVDTVQAKIYKENVFASSTVITVRNILENTAKNGTGKSGTKGLLDTMRICSKTGTAQVSTNESGEIGWYAGYVIEGGENDAVLVSSDISDYKFAFVRHIFTLLRDEQGG